MIPATRSSFAKQVRDLGHLAKGQANSAELLAKAVLYRWQLQSFNLTKRRVPRGTSHLVELPEVRNFAAWLAEQTDFNEAAYWLASAYAVWVGDATRTARSLYFTPPRLADRVIDNLVVHGASLTRHHWHDPACGGAAFLVPIAQRMALALAEQGLGARAILETIEAKLSGTDLDETLIFLSKQFLLMALASLVREADYEPIVEIRCADGLTAQGALQAYDVVACNPPYRKLRAEEAQRYASEFESVIEGQPNVYGLFIDRSLRIARQGGYVGLLTPTSFLSGQYFSKLRTKLLSHSEVLQLDVLSDRKSMFIDVQQETAVTTLRSKAPTRSSVATTSVSVLGQHGLFTNVGPCVLPSSGRPWAIPRSSLDAELLQAAERCGARLRDFGYVARVGNLVAYRDQRLRHPARPEPGHGRVAMPLVWATDITPQGQFIHGRQQRDSRTDSFVEMESATQPGITRRPSVVLQRVTSSDQKRRLVAAAVPNAWLRENGGFVSENHVIVLELVDERGWSPENFARLLQTEAVDRVFRAMSGASNVSLFELNELPLPHPKSLKPPSQRQSDFELSVEVAYLDGQPQPEPALQERRAGLSRGS